MEDSELKEQIQRTIDDLVSIRDITPTNGWNESLLRRLKTSSRKSLSGKLIIASVCVIVAVNMACGFRMLSQNSLTAKGAGNSLEQLSKELLINPISAKE
jgi:hypothetical protein